MTLHTLKLVARYGKCDEMTSQTLLSYVGCQKVTFRNLNLALLHQGNRISKITAGASRPASSLSTTQTSAIPDYQEWYIPLTRRHLVKALLDDHALNFGDGATQAQMKRIAAEVDVAVSNQYHSVLHDMKRLYFPINPDKEMMNGGVGSEASTGNDDVQVSLHETRFLTLLRKVLKEANFQQLSHESMMKVLKEHNVGDGVIVSVNPSNYSTLCFWVLDKKTITAPQMDWIGVLYERYKNLTGRWTPIEQQVYSRVIVAVRKKGSKSLQLKGYKDVPVGALEQILPDGKVRMRSFDRNLLITMCLLGSASMAMRTTTQLTSMNVKSGSLIAMIVSAMIGLNSYFAYGNRRNSYLLELSEMHYYKNIANNLALITLLIDRVQDEIFKEAMLVYAHLVTHGQLGMPLVRLEGLVEGWTLRKLQRPVRFDSRPAIEFLSEIGLVSRTGHLIFPKDLTLAAQSSVIQDHRYFAL